MTATEWRTEGGGFKDRSGGGFKRLPFHCCAIAFTPFEDPVSSPASLYAFTLFALYGLDESLSSARRR